MLKTLEMALGMMLVASLLVGMASAAFADDMVGAAADESPEEGLALASGEANEDPVVEGEAPEVPDETSSTPSATPSDTSSAPSAATPPDATVPPAAESRSVVLVANDGSGEERECDVSDGRVPACPFAWDRHRFVGWGLSADALPEEGLLVVGEDLAESVSTIFALWQKDAPPDLPHGCDFSSCRLIVGSQAQPDCGDILSASEGVWLLGFEDALDAAWAYVDLQDEVDFVAPDIEVAVAGAGTGAGEQADQGVAAQDAPSSPELFEAVRIASSPSEPGVPAAAPDCADAPADLSVIDQVCGAADEGGDDVEDVVALVDTGVNGYEGLVADRLSVLGGTVFDDNGHGTSMMATMAVVDPQVRVVSIKALDAQGTGSAAGIYAAIECAVQLGAKVVNLSLYAPAVEGNAAVEQAIRDAWEAGVIVVGAAGNDGRDARFYVPGRMGEEAVIVGSCDGEGNRSAQSNYGETVDLYVPSDSTSRAAAKVSAWLRAHGTFGHELEALSEDAAHAALEHVTQVEQGADEAPVAAEPTPFTTAWTHPAMQVRAHFSMLGWKSWTNTNADLPGGGKTDSATNWNTYHAASGVWQNIENIQVRIGSFGSWTAGGSVQYRTYYQDTGYDGWKDAPNSSPAATGKDKRVEGVEMKLTGSIANAYDISYKMYSMTHSPAHSPGNDTSLNHKWFSGTNGSYAGTTGHALGLEVLRVWLTPKSLKQVVQVRYQNANGTFGSYSNVVNTGYATGSTVSWSRAQDATHQAASLTYTVTSTNTKQVTVYRRSSTNTIRARYQNADGTWGAYANVSSGTDLVGAQRSWSRAADATYKAASGSITATATGQTKNVDVARRTYTVAFSGNGASGGSMGSQTFYVGQRKALSSNAFVRGGFGFVGWNTAANASGTSFANAQSVSDLTGADKTVTLYAMWEEKMMRVRVPVALHCVQQRDGVVVGPSDGVAQLANTGQLAVQVSEVRTEVFEPYDLSLELTLPKRTLAAGESVGLSGLRGTMEVPVTEEREVGCIHWSFRAVS